MVTVILRFIYILSLALWIGGTAFFPFIAASSIFKVLSRAEAGKVVADIIPKYYWASLACGAIAVIASTLLGVRTRWSVLLIVRTILIGVMIVGILYAMLALQPKMQELREQVAASDILSPTRTPLRLEFGLLHRRSESVHAAVLLLGVVVMFITAFTMKV